MEMETQTAAAAIMFGALLFLVLVRWGSVKVVNGIVTASV